MIKRVKQQMKDIKKKKTRIKDVFDIEYKFQKNIINRN